MILAEAVSIDGGLLTVILAGFILAVLLWLGLVVLGCSLARRAGHGSRAALAGWTTVAVVETVPLVVGVTPLALVAVAVIGLQATFWARARAEAGGRQSWW